MPEQSNENQPAAAASPVETILAKPADDQAISADASARAAAAAVQAAEEEAKAKAAAAAKAVEVAMHAEIEAIGAELERLKTRLHDAAKKVAAEGGSDGYVRSFINDVRHKTAEIHDWMSRHGF